jgi:uncharacterized protein (TIGR02246 family)
MRSSFFVIAFLVTALHSLAQNHKTYNAKNLAALKLLPVKWEQYWNSHNMDSMGTMLREDVDFVNVAGVWLKGKADAVEDHRQKHLTMFKTSVWTTDSVDVKYIKKDVAVLHINWGLSGDFDPDGTPRQPRNGIFTWVVTKENGQWLLAAVHNVNKRKTVVSTRQ